ncbi:hypothetical protein LIER_24345 [Lithospermum erythrorhizon]|uniref:Uncharacterized protein n=1 Tax=Lithospermum erythrorhizon TaxID=34254 RepID=A0AAV3R6J7_LITER
MKASMSKVNRISLTTDLWWSNEQNIGYMTVTGHYINSKWQLNRRVLSFINVPPPHSGVVLAKELIKVMDDWAIKNRVVSIIVDNASTNDKCIRRLKEDFSGKQNLSLKDKLFHVCCAHILNLLVKDGLSVIQDSIER